MRSFSFPLSVPATWLSADFAWSVRTAAPAAKLMLPRFSPRFSRGLEDAGGLAASWGAAAGGAGDDIGEGSTGRTTGAGAGSLAEVTGAGLGTGTGSKSAAADVSAAAIAGTEGAGFAAVEGGGAGASEAARAGAGSGGGGAAVVTGAAAGTVGAAGAAGGVDAAGAGGGPFSASCGGKVGLLLLAAAGGAKSLRPASFRMNSRSSPDTRPLAGKPASRWKSTMARSVRAPIRPSVASGS